MQVKYIWVNTAYYNNILVDIIKMIKYFIYKYSKAFLTRLLF